MNITVDTNVLVRAVVGDHAAQSRAAEKVLRAAEVIAVTLPTLCEFVWVLRKVYNFSPAEIGAAIRALLDARNVIADLPAVEAGLAILEAGGDFADGVIAYEGQRLGGETFVSFDKKGIALLAKRGVAAKLLGD